MYTQKIKKSPDFSPFAKEYAQSRPQYPPELFSYLASLVEQHNLAWDCATGNGQAALELVKHFKRVIATDVSSEQIKHTAAHSQIEYRIARAERSGLESKSVDLITVASAVHWFDLDDFFSEVQRVVRQDGILAVWTYHVGYVESPFDRIFEHFYRQVISPYFAQGAKLVDDRYESIRLPGKPVDTADFYVNADWNLEQMLAFIGSWSGTQQYIKEIGKNPVDLVFKELQQIWGKSETIHTIRWPLYLKISRL